MKELTHQQKEELRKRVLADEEFMAGVRKSLAEWRAGGSKVTPWEEVKQELGIQ